MLAVSAASSSRSAREAASGPGADAGSALGACPASSPNEGAAGADPASSIDDTGDVAEDGASQERQTYHRYQVYRSNWKI